MPYREKADVLKEITKELESFQAPANGKDVREARVPELFEAGCATASPLTPATPTAPTTEARTSNPV